jgi:Glycosyl transferase family 2/DUF218 domain
MLPRADVLVIDDGSTDATSTIAREAGAHVVQFRRHRGLRQAIAAGYAYADEHGYDACVRLDADGQHPAAEARRLLDPVVSGQYDLAIGSRYSGARRADADRYRSPVARRVGTAVIRRVMLLVLGRAVTDPLSGMWAANRSAMRLLAAPYAGDAPELESLVRAHRAGLRVREVPVEMRPRRDGASRLPVAGVLLSLAHVIAERARMRRGRPGEHTDGAIVVLGSGVSENGSYRLSTRCLDCLELAADLAAVRRPRLVVFSGWGRVAGMTEAAQMLERWGGRRDIELAIEPTARITAENMSRSLPILVERGIAEVTVVCGAIHQGRVRTIFGAYRRYGIRVSFCTVPEKPHPRTVARETIAWALVPRHRRRASAELSRLAPRSSAASPPAP